MSAVYVKCDPAGAAPGWIHGLHLKDFRTGTGAGAGYVFDYDCAVPGTRTAEDITILNPKGITRDGTPFFQVLGSHDTGLASYFNAQISGAVITDTGTSTPSAYDVGANGWNIPSGNIGKYQGASGSGFQNVVRITSAGVDTLNVGRDFTYPSTANFINEPLPYTTPLSSNRRIAFPRPTDPDHITADADQAIVAGQHNADIFVDGPLTANRNYTLDCKGTRPNVSQNFFLSASLGFSAVFKTNADCPSGATTLSTVVPGGQAHFVSDGNGNWSTISALADPTNAANMHGTIPATVLPSTGWSPYQNTVLLTASSGTWTVPAGITKIEVCGTAGGGGGGSVGTGAAATATGGTSGEYGCFLYQTTPGATISYTSGAGGAGASAGGTNGSNGSPSVFGTLTLAGGLPGVGISSGNATSRSQSVMWSTMHSVTPSSSIMPNLHSIGINSQGGGGVGGGGGQASLGWGLPGQGGSNAAGADATGYGNGGGGAGDTASASYAGGAGAPGAWQISY